VATGDKHTCIATSNNTVCFGYNNSNQTDIPSGFQNGVKQISAGERHTCMSKENLTQCFGL